MMDTHGNKEARAEITMIKAAAPNMVFRVIDRAIQAFGGAGVTSGYGRVYAYATHGESTFSPITEDPGRRAGGRQAKPALEQQVLETRTALGEVEFGDKKKHPGLQAADALAFGAYKLMPTNPQMIDMPEGDTLAQANQRVAAEPPIYHCCLDAAMLGALKSDILTMVELRKRYAAEIAASRQVAERPDFLRPRAHILAPWQLASGRTDIAPLALKNQFGTQAAALISPNSRTILRQEAPASSLT